MGEAMLELHNFWVELYPSLQNGYDFVYVFLDVLTILSLFRVISTLPTLVLTGRMRGLK